MWAELAKKIEHLNYVVQRNWANLPKSCEVGTHKDLDLFVSEEDRPELEEILQDYPLVDCRSKSDHYYPEEIGDMLLVGRRKFNGFWIPDSFYYFTALYYHNAVHKQGDPYKDELRQAFLEAYPPQKCTDEGVGYYV